MVAKFYLPLEVGIKALPFVDVARITHGYVQILQAREARLFCGLGNAQFLQ